MLAKFNFFLDLKQKDMDIFFLNTKMKLQSGSY